MGSGEEKSWIRKSTGVAENSGKHFFLKPISYNLNLLHGFAWLMLFRDRCPEQMTPWSASDVMFKC